MFGDFLGYADVGATFLSAVTITDADGGPQDPTLAPTYRAYDGQNLVATGSLTKLETVAITGITDANPMTITSAGHGRQTGDVITINGALGNTAANATWAITVIDANTFTLPGAGNGTYTSGGTFHTTGLYQLSLDCSLPGFESGGTYQILVNWLVGGVTPLCKLLTLGVL